MNAIHEIPETNDHVNALKTRHVFFGRVQIGQKFIILRAFFFESTIKTLAIIHIRFRYLVDCIHCEIFFVEKSVIKKIWQKCGRQIST